LKTKILLFAGFLFALFSGGVFSRAYAAELWQPDPVVTAVGRSAARAKEILNWVLAIKDAGFSDSPAIHNAWQKIVNINVAIIFILLIVLAFGLILKAGWAQEQKKTIIILIVAFAASYLSYTGSIIVINTVDQFQARLLNISVLDPVTGKKILKPLQAEDLLSVSFDYQDFKGIRNSDPLLQESANNNLLLVKLTTWTNYAIAGVILLRIVLLWLLVVFSPLIFPCLAFAAIRNVAIVWLREFGRWLFLGPLFAIFLTAVVYIWQNTTIEPTFLPSGVSGIDRKSGIPLDAKSDGEAKNIYESGTNIILMPPGVTKGKLQMKDQKGGNNLSETDTYMRYIVALLMIWAAIILPFLLLRIIMSVSVKAGAKIINTLNQSAIKNYLSSLTTHNPPIEPKTPPPGPIITREITKKDIPFVSSNQTTQKNIETSTISKTIEKMSVPQLIREAGALPEIGEIITSSSSSKLSRLSQLEQNKDKFQNSSEVLDKISNPEKIEDKQEQQKYSAIKNSVYMKSVMGDKTAVSLNNAVTKNFTHYLSSNISDQLYQNSLNDFSKNLTTIYEGDESSTKIFQQTYGVADKTLLDYLQRAQTQISGANQQTIPLAIEAINEIKGVLTLKQPSEQGKKDYIAQVATKLANPEKITDEKDKQKYTALKRVLDSGRKVGDKNFADLEQDGVVVASLLKLQENPSAENLSSATNSIAKSIEKDEDFANSRTMWKKHYLEAPIPAGTGKTRKEWIQSEILKLEGVLGGLISPDETQKKKAIEQTEKILPLMAVSGYEAADVVRYVKAKLQAAKEVLSNLIKGEKSENEDDLVTVDVKKKTEDKANQMQMTTEQPENKL